MELETMKKTNGRNSNTRQKSRTKNLQDGQVDLGKRHTALLVSAGIAVVVVASLVLWGIKTSGDSPSAADQRVSAPQTTVPAPNFQSVVGRWIRIDSPYVIDIENADQDGKLEAKYYNPRPINVSVARVRAKNDALEVFVELRDTNYPGSTYTLTYDSTRELLMGVYFQATMKQKYNVVFRRQQTN
jgi:hypothetical protein